MHCSRMRTISTLPYGGLPGRDPPEKRPPWTETPIWTETPSLDSDPLPGQRPPLWTETPRAETPCTETPPPWTDKYL